MQHVKEMVTGTPLLLRQLGEKGGKENLQIHVFQVDSKCQVLSWTDTDGSPAGDVSISSIVDVSEETSNDPEDMGGMLRVTSVNAKGLEQTMDMIFASREDVITWRDGLRFLVDAAHSTKAASPTASVAISKKARTSEVVAGAGLSTAEGASERQLVERIQLQQDLISELRQENRVLHDITKQKDEITKQKDLEIARLSQELKNRGTKMEQLSKTESTSRESDDHLRDREMAIVKRKNLRLKKMVQKKQKTITNLMQTLQNALGGQASDADMLQTEDDDDEADSDMALGSAPAAVAAARALDPQCLTDSDSDPEAIREEVQALTRKRQSPKAASPQPPQSPQQLAARKARERAELVAAATKAGFGQATSSPSAAMAGFDFSAVGGVPATMGRGSMSKNSKTALEALSREMQLLEDKKRTVEQLARHLEPPSDNEEEDDGFPLQ